MQCDYIGCTFIQSVISPYHSFRIHSPDIQYSCTNSFSGKIVTNGDVPILVITVKAVWVATPQPSEECRWSSRGEGEMPRRLLIDV